MRLNIFQYFVIMKNLFISLAISLLFSSQFILGQEVNYPKFGIETVNTAVPEGLKPGDKAPDFTGYDQNGKQIQSKKILESGPMVLFFYRGKWCPVCSNYLNDYQDSINILTGMGVNVVAITPESIENVEQTVKLHNISFTVVYDCQEQIMKDFKVMFSVSQAYQDQVMKYLTIDIAKNNGRDVAHLPVPATFIISRDGIIIAVQFDPDYNNRASVKWMIKNLASAL
jgi:peroxiredoxin